MYNDTYLTPEKEAAAPTAHPNEATLPTIKLSPVAGSERAMAVPMSATWSKHARSSCKKSEYTM